MNCYMSNFGLKNNSELVDNIIEINSYDDFKKYYRKIILSKL